jgi:hypothetical protein
MEDDSIFQRTLMRAKSAGVDISELADVIVFQETEIERYRNKIKTQEKMLEDMQKVAANEYTAGLETAWSAAQESINNRKLWEFCDLDPGECFITKYSVHRALGLINSYQNDRHIRVGDEIKSIVIPEGEIKAIVIKINSVGHHKVYIVWDARSTKHYYLHDGAVTKTGRHFPQVEELMEQLKEEVKPCQK